MSYDEVRIWCYTMGNILPIGHRGLIAVKALWKFDHESGQEDFSGQIFMLWCSSVLASRCVQELRGIVLRQERGRDYPVIAEISRSPFMFPPSSQPSTAVNAINQGWRVWRNLEREDGVMIG